MRKPSKDDLTAGSEMPHYYDPVMKKVYPWLYDALASSTYSDGSKKGPGMLIIKPRSKVLSATLKVEGSGLMLRCEGDTLDTLFKALDALLGTDPCPWEEDPYQVTKAPKRNSR